jgi:DNA-binding FadR family transcriptional regulator
MGKMKKVDRGGLHERVVREIGVHIITGEFAPNAALPSEAELCNTLGVSRTALREALRVLAAKGLVEAKRKIGTMVRPVKFWNYLDADVLSWQLQGKDSDRVIAELYELRYLIEPLAAALAARNAKATDIVILREAYRNMLEAGDDGEKIAGPDVAFHQGIIAASGNRLFSSLAHVVGAALSANFEYVREAPRGHKFLMPAHKKILDAIVDHNASAARVGMQKLIEESHQEAYGVRNVKGRAKTAR